jgi:nitrogen fixation NifU-like protein
MEEDKLDNLYQEIILDHYRRPRNQNLIENSEIKAEGFNPFCGDRIIITANFSEQGIINQVGMKGEGCAISQASASMMSEILKGKTLENIVNLTQTFRGMMRGNELSEKDITLFGELMALEGVREFPVRIKCALLAWSALDEGINNYKK